MTQDEKKRLERNLTKSGARARTGYVRIKTGPLAEDQGFAPIDNLPIFNTIRNNETSLKTFIEDIKELYDKVNILSDTLIQLESRIEVRRKEIITNRTNIENITERVRAIELFNLD